MPGRRCLKLAVCGYFYISCKKQVLQIMLKTHSTSHYEVVARENGQKKCVVQKEETAV